MIKILAKILKRKKKFICPGAFSQAFIYPDGKFFLCPNCYISPDSEIGNINNSSFEDIYNSKKAIKIRSEILKGRYKYCSPYFCISKSNINAQIMPTKNIEYKKFQTKPPQMVCIAPDLECNISCIMCRGEIIKYNDKDLKEITEKIKKIYIDIPKAVEKVTFSTLADPFASRPTRLMMKETAKRYPNLKFNIITNGILCDEKNCEETGIINRMSKVCVSLHSSNEETYNKIIKMEISI